MSGRTPYGGFGAIAACRDSQLFFHFGDLLSLLS